MFDLRPQNFLGQKRKSEKIVWNHGNRNKNADIKKQKKTTKQFRKIRDLLQKKSDVGLKDVYDNLFFVFTLPTKPVCDKFTTLLLWINVFLVR